VVPEAPGVWVPDDVGAWEAPKSCEVELPGAGVLFCARTRGIQECDGWSCWVMMFPSNGSGALGRWLEVAATADKRFVWGQPGSVARCGANPGAAAGHRSKSPRQSSSRTVRLMSAMKRWKYRRLCKLTRIGPSISLARNK